MSDVDEEYEATSEGFEEECEPEEDSTSEQDYESVSEELLEGKLTC